MPVVKHEPDFAELVDRAAERRNRSTEQWNNAIYDLYGATIDPITLAYRRWIGKVSPVAANPNADATGAIPTTQSTLKNSSLAYMLIIGPLMYPRLLVICFAILTLLFRLSDHTLRENTTALSNTLDLVINVYFTFEGALRLFTIPAVFEIRRRHFEDGTKPANSLAYEILRCGWVEIIISLVSITISNEYDNTNSICWFNLLRLSFIANFFVLELPQIEVLLSGIYSGLRSIVSTWFLLIITFVIYGVLTTASFQENDPAHFSTVGASMFTLFRVSTMDNWSEVNYINAYGCDSVPTDYKVISRNSTEPRYVDVFSGRMYLFLCDSPNAHPYLSSFIFTSFVVLTGFMLISLTVAAVSGGVHLRLEEIQLQKDHEDEDRHFDLDQLDSQSDEDTPEVPKEVEQKRIRAHTFYGRTAQLPAGQTNTSQPNPQPSNPSPAALTQKLDSLRAKMSKIDSVVEEFEEDDNDSDAQSNHGLGTIFADSVSELIDVERQDSKSSIEPPDRSSDTDDGGIEIRRVTHASAMLTLSNLQKQESEESPRDSTPMSQHSADDLPQSTPELSSSSITHTDLVSPVAPKKSPIITSRKSIRPTARVVKEALPLLQDKDLLRMMVKQMWNEVELEKKRLEEEAGGSGSIEHVVEEKPSSQRISGLFNSSSESIRGITGPRGNQPITPGSARSFTQLQRHSSFRQNSDATTFDSTKKISYYLKNVLSSYYYLGYIVLIVLVTASFQIYCTNKYNCRDYQGVFIAVQILLSLDIIIRVLTYFPTCKSFFFSRHNLFDLGMVLIIWIPVFYTGYGAQIAESARIVYLLRLLPLLSWITDLQIIMLSVASSIRPLLYVVGMMFLMFFHFAVAGVLIFKQNDEFYFGTLYRAMNALFQICTLDNWGDIALKNMYGCDYYGSDTGVDVVDAMCQTPLGLGWIAAWYFLVFITFSVMILQSLFVGIIISAMELLKDSVSQEAEIWKVIHQKAEKYGLQNSTLMNLLEIFNALDVGLNGTVTESELEPLLSHFPPITHLPALMAQIGKVSGKLTFPEFIEFIHFMGIKLHAYKLSPRHSQ